VDSQADPPLFRIAARRFCNHRHTLEKRYDKVALTASRSAVFGSNLSGLNPSGFKPVQV
jgi:hypothetical protein